MKHPIRRRLMYLGFLGLRGFVLCLPLAVARMLGRFIALISYALLGYQRRLTQEHLAFALAERVPEAERRRIARRVFMNLGENFMEWLVIPRLSKNQLQALVICEGFEHLEQVIAQGRGAIVLSGHFGNWEIMPIYTLTRGLSGSVLARRLRYPEYESFFIQMRAAKGVKTLERGSIKKAAQVLRSNQIIGLMPDQDISDLDGIFVDFFGHPAHTPVGPAVLSIMTGAPIVPVFNIREGARFRFIIERPIPTPETKDRAQAIRELTYAWSRKIESYIARYPDHWVWMHRRWKSQPESAHSRQQAAGSRQQAELKDIDPEVKNKRQRADVSRLHPIMSCLLFAACSVLFAGISGCGKKATAPSIERAESSEGMGEFKLTGYDADGSKSWDLTGLGAEVESDIVNIREPKGVGYEADRTAYLRASAAQYNQRNRRVRMEQDVTIHTSDGLWFTTPILYWNPADNTINTDQPVRIETDHMLLRGRGMEGFTQLKHATAFDDIEMILNPTNNDVGEHGQVIITCDGPLTFDYENQIATFEKNVHVKDPKGDLYSDKLVAYLDEATRTIRYAEALGRVRIQQKENHALSSRAIYEPAKGKVTLVGRPSLTIYPSGEGSAPNFGELASTRPAGAASRSRRNREITSEVAAQQAARDSTLLHADNEAKAGKESAASSR